MFFACFLERFQNNNQIDTAGFMKYGSFSVHSFNLSIYPTVHRYLKEPFSGNNGYQKEPFL